MRVLLLLSLFFVSCEDELKEKEVSEISQRISGVNEAVEILKEEYATAPAEEVFEKLEQARIAHAQAEQHIELLEAKVEHLSDLNSELSAFYESHKERYDRELSN